MVLAWGPPGSGSGEMGSGGPELTLRTLIFPRLSPLSGESFSLFCLGGSGLEFENNF